MAKKTQTKASPQPHYTSLVNQVIHHHQSFIIIHKSLPLTTFIHLISPHSFSLKLKNLTLETTPLLKSDYMLLESMIESVSKIHKLHRTCGTH
ncbi:hypothetical protein BON22_0995 [Cyberlindnera fabianii]|uniref:Uncharacterized protein n=1 Tax=Cyberlindnera fabianii TaxID=36022 RepID=A0A1V2L9G4_CYBFA|nr:hypothetical protein BON22_0995 [Cyberlindnera fabianii]